MPRFVTRSNETPPHIAITSEEFATRKRANGFVLSWDANGWRYGVSKDLEDRLAAGQSVILNGSRSIVDLARSSFSPLKVIHVTAPLDVLSRRLRERGREDAESIEHRLARAERMAPNGPDVCHVDNSGTLEDGIDRLLTALDQTQST